MSEYDASSGTWVSTSHVVVPRPSQDTSAMVAAKDKHKEGVLTKVGNTLKKPLTWLPWHKDEAKPDPAVQPQAVAR